MFATQNEDDLTVDAASTSFDKVEVEKYLDVTSFTSKMSVADVVRFNYLLLCCTLHTISAMNFSSLLC